MSIYLYHKRHVVTGLNYFGQSKNEPSTYSGSGIYWRNHLRVHGKLIENIQIWEFNDVVERSKFAIQFSIKNDIVKSDKWANLCVEDGLMGGDKLSSMTEQRLGEIRTGRSKIQKVLWQTRDRVVQANTTSDIWAERTQYEKDKIYSKISNTMMNKTLAEREQIAVKRKATEASRTAEFKEDLRLRRAETLAKRPNKTCPHCGLQGKSHNMDRYHFSNCRSIVSE